MFSSCFSLSITAREMGIDESIHLQLVDENNAVVITSLIESSSSYNSQHHHSNPMIYPYNYTGFHVNSPSPGASRFSGSGGGSFETKSNSRHEQHGTINSQHETIKMHHTLNGGSHERDNSTFDFQFLVLFLSFNFYFIYFFTLLIFVIYF